MEFILLLIVWILGAVILWLYTHYNPKIDCTVDNNYYMVYLWYYKHESKYYIQNNKIKKSNSVYRTYKLLFKIKI